eukprot:TRINITY_DN4038_c0_g1_i1.p1 TRINITY_DN4038_c0_g1~~TRINITY_DN4038_c0_g1_i1.p1  ORF type:complete len:188 (+),score=53.95 TRINITY_DN4038_c0_g1_i1:46-609(+)
MGLFFTSLIVLVVALLYAAGFFDVVLPPELSVALPWMAVVVPKKGPFSQLGEVFSLAAAGFGDDATVHGERNGVGLYYEDPALVAEPRWAVGFVCADRAECDAVAAKVDGAIVVSMPASRCWRSSMPWRHQLSPMFNAMRVWGPFMAAVPNGDDENTVAIEFYDEAAGVERFVVCEENADVLLAGRL